MMRNPVFTWILIGTTVLLISCYVIFTYLSHEVIAPVSISHYGKVITPSVNEPHSINPLLTADKAAVSRWFSGDCFAELYVGAPPFGGKLIPNCIDSVIKQIEAETGIKVTAAEINSDAVKDHFKQVYGANNPWRQ
jgi:hypothetical protein